jgi:hypothetical protein
MMKKLAFFWVLFLVGCKGDISDEGLHYCSDMLSEYEVKTGDASNQKIIESKIEHVDDAYLNVISNRKFAFTYQLNNLWHTDSDMKYENYGDNMAGTSISKEQDPTDKSLTIEKTIALTVNTYTGETKRSLTKTYFNKDKSVVKIETRAISGQCDFDAQNI